MSDEKNRKKEKPEQKRVIATEDFILDEKLELKKAYVEKPLPPRESMPEPKKPEKKPMDEED